MWEQIMTTYVKNRQEHYQFYFNLFYVALTRARKNLYLYEQNQNTKIIHALSPLFERVSNNVISILDISEYQSNAEMLEQALKHFANEEYDRAKIYFHHLGMKKDVVVCRGYELIQRGEFESGIQLLYRFKEQQENLFKFTDTKETPLFHYLVGYKYKKLTIEQIHRSLDGHSLIDLMIEYKDDKNYINLYIDTLDLMQEIQKYRINIELGDYYGRINQKD
jgi:superfamily I DNA/RNA helicase